MSRPMSNARWLTLDDGMTIWRARDIYRVQNVVYGFWFLCCAMPFALQLLIGTWRGRVATLAVGMVLFWGVPWLLKRTIRLAWRGGDWLWQRGVTRMKGVAMKYLGMLMLGLLLGSLSGCMDAAMHWSKMQGIQFKDGYACTLTQVQAGQCRAAQAEVKP